MNERVKNVNKFIMFYVIVQYILMSAFSIYETRLQERLIMPIWTCGVGGALVVVSILVFFKHSNSIKLFYLLTADIACMYTGMLLFTNYSELFVFCFLTNACVILLSDVKLSLLSNVAIMICNTGIFTYRIMQGTQTRTSGIVHIVITFVYSLCWLKIMSIERNFVQEDKRVIIEQTKEQEDKVLELEKASKEMGEFIRNINNLAQEEISNIENN